MNFAVIKLQGHQEIVSQGQKLEVDRVEAKVGEKINPQVLLTSVDGEIQVGTPFLDFPVELEVQEQKRGEKIYVQKFHAKARFRRRTGFRRELSVLKVVKFGAQKTVKVAKKATTRTVKKAVK